MLKKELEIQGMSHHTVVSTEDVYINVAGGGEEELDVQSECDAQGDHGAEEIKGDMVTRNYLAFQRPAEEETKGNRKDSVGGPLQSKLKNSVVKPPYLYIVLITMFILHNPQRKLTVGDIYNLIIPYYLQKFPTWHNLSLNNCFFEIS
ncbi:forkhead box protein D3 [Arapaima gigas]